MGLTKNIKKLVAYGIGARLIQPEDEIFMINQYLDLFGLDEYDDPDIDDEKIITFDLGVIGFEDCKKFTLIYDVDKGDEASIMWLQSLDEPELALPMLKPELIKEDYDPIVEDEMLKALGSDIKEADLIVFCVLTVPADITKMTINFKAPIIVNADTLKGVQLIADNNDYEVRYPIYSILEERKGE